jgi:hypothetical protein
MVKYFSFFIFLLIIFSCKRNYSGFDNEYVEKYSSEKIKLVKRWNDTNADKVVLHFDKNGDTIFHSIEKDIAFHLYKEPLLENEENIYKGEKVSYNDTTYISFQWGKNNSYVSEYILMIDGSVNFEKSLYVFLKETSSGIKFRCIGTDIDKFGLIYYELKDTICIDGDTIYSKRNQEIYLSKKKIKRTKGNAVIYKEIFPEGQDERLFEYHEIPILLSFKKEIQNEFGINRLKFSVK